MKTLEYNSKRLAKRIRVLMKASSNVIVSTSGQKDEPQMQETHEQDKHEQEAHRHETHKQPVLLTQQVIDFLKVQYDFRYNLLTEETEFRPFGQRNIPFCRIEKPIKKESTAGTKTFKDISTPPKWKVTTHSGSI